ncbi:MAG: GNAT family N-acetyltransferase [Planctomycetes bacterium]|nr:GNAT family N-acetyltransferase [Planctomycetota bacterium]
MAERHPPTPHWYLLALATAPEYCGQGLAGRLLEEMLARCDRESQTIALETSQESNLAFYQQFGFTVTDELLIDVGVKSWLMCREAGSL